MFCYIFRISNMSVYLGLTVHIKHLQCRSTAKNYALHCENYLGMIWDSAGLTFSHAYHLCVAFRTI